MTTFNALNRYGNLVRSFGTRELAEAYQAEMDAIGCVSTIEEVWLCRAA